VDVNLGGFVAAFLGVALVATLWVRVRMFATLATEQSVMRIEATRRAIESLDKRLVPRTDAGAARRRRAKRRRRRKTDWRNA